MEMNFALVYVVQRLLFRIEEFFRHWYVDGTRHFYFLLVSQLRQAEYALALRITVRHIFQPLYGDYSIVGRIVGPIFRFCRVVIGLALYFLVLAVFFVGYIIWIFIPPLILLYGFRII